jgi:branched-chain amino acid transport system permease protein
MALALVVVYKTARVLNFAQGTLSGLGGYLTWLFVNRLSLPWPLAALGALAGAALIGLVLERVAVRPILSSGLFAVVVATLAVDAFLLNATGRLFGTTPLPLPPPLPGLAISLPGLRVTSWSLVVIGVGAVTLVATSTLVNRTELGLAMRAFAEDPYASTLMGVPRGTVSRATWVLSAVVGAVAGILLGPILFLEVGYMNGVFIGGFTAAILGGFTSFAGAVAGGLLFGLIDALAVRYAPGPLIAMLPLLLVLAVLLLRPQGLFTRTRRVERV